MVETIHSNRYNPCKGCPDRYPACSDHCRKQAYLDWKAEQKKSGKQELHTRLPSGQTLKQMQLTIGNGSSVNDP